MQPNQSLNQTQSFLMRRFAEVGIRPKTRHGQNFLIDLNLLRVLVDAAQLEPCDVVLEVGTGLRAQRWATHEDELTGLLDKVAEFSRGSSKPFVLILHPAHVETIVVRAKQLARERGLVVFDSFERSAAAIRVAYDYWSGRAARAS